MGLQRHGDGRDECRTATAPDPVPQFRQCGRCATHVKGVRRVRLPRQFIRLSPVLAYVFPELPSSVWSISFLVLRRQGRTKSSRCSSLHNGPSLRGSTCTAPDVSGSSKTTATPKRRVRPRLFRPQAFVFVGLSRMRLGQYAYGMDPDELEEHIADKHSPS